MRAGKFSEEIQVYNERLNSVIQLVTVKHAVATEEWRVQYQQDSAKMMDQLCGIHDMQKVIYRALKQFDPNDDILLVVKRDLHQAPPETSRPLDPVLRNIVSVSEKINKKVVRTPPSWLIAADECELIKPAIDQKGQSQIFAGKWQGVQVAVKKFRISSPSPVFDKHFGVWRSLLHPHIAQLYGVGSDSGAPFFVYEYASRQSLDRCWEYFSEKELWRMLHQAALGLSYLHARHVVHGNLCASKLLVADQDKVKLFGFGASYIREGDTSNSLHPTTRVEFSAPECIGIGPDGNDDGINHSPHFKSDVYSFGLTIIEATTRKDPFQGLPLSDIRDIKRSNLLQQPKEMNIQAWSLVQEMCLCDPDKRVSLAYVVEQLGRFAE
ncbi:Serine/threonine protein Kinase [Phytophthora cinnamomi]|uniref:Serine/threonine protein Kinase n=1 Tax=Phytophthora cinnamomi TaxID=4785 RepID=UPI0035599D80|nr:Serine/threonine protein Kinase [Phytophthora cinnamomi]